jgi:hypothetical protein
MLLRTGVVVASMAAVLAARPVGHVPTWVEVGVALVALIAAASPGSMAGLALMLLIGEPWLAQSPEAGSSPWLLATVGGAVIAHLCLLLAAQGPASAAPDIRQLGVWAGRGALLWCAAALVWAGSRLLETTPAPSTVAVTVLALLLMAMVGTGRWISRRS